MSLSKRGETWWIRFTAPNGRRIQRSARTEVKQEAQELHDRLKAEAWRIQELNEKPSYLWQDAVKKWLVEQAEKASIRQDKIHLRWVHQYLFDKKLEDISKDLLDQIKSAKKETGVSNATVNRLLAVIRAILNRAKNEWEWIDSVPYIRLLPEPKKRIRWLSQNEASRLVKELPDHLALMMRFTLSTGLRESNVTNLQWSQIDMQRRCAWVHADQAKARKAIAIPLNDDSMDIIERLKGQHKTHVFTYKGEPVLRANKHAWRNALKRAGIKEFRWHDLRHTWAGWHVQNGTPLNVLQELGGWSEPTMVQRYAHLSPDHLAEYAGNASFIGTNLVHA